MLQNLGRQIRSLRERKGITLNDFAKQVNVSPGYLSNLETGKTDTVSLSFLEQIQKELSIFPQDSTQSDDGLTYRLKRAGQLLNELGALNPQAAEYLLSTLENGVEWFSKTK